MSPAGRPSRAAPRLASHGGTSAQALYDAVKKSPSHPDLATPRCGEVTDGQAAPRHRRMTMAQSLVVLKFDTPDGADKGLELAASLQKQRLLELLDAAVVTWPKGQKK